MLCAFGDHKRTMTISEVADACGMNKSSAQRMVYTLEKLGYIEKHPSTRRYQLTVRALRPGFNYLAGNTLIDIANPYLSELTNTTQETTCLTEPDSFEMVYVARFVSSKFVPVHMPIGSRVPMYCTGAGRAYLSALPEQERRKILEAQNLTQHTMHTNTNAADLIEMLNEASRRGYSVNREELFLGDMTLGAPVIGRNGRPIAAVHVVAPTSRWTMQEAEQRLAPALITCARALSTAVKAMD